MWSTELRWWYINTKTLWHKSHCQRIELKVSMGSDSSSMEAAWKQSAASLIRPSCLLSNPKQCQAMRLVGSIRSASDSALLAAQKNFGPTLWIMAPIKILHGTWFGSNSIPLIVARRASSFCPRPSDKTPAKAQRKIWSSIKIPSNIHKTLKQHQDFGLALSVHYCCRVLLQVPGLLQTDFSILPTRKTSI